MPIKSYLAHPHEHQKEALVAALTAIENCDIIPAENKDIVVVVTETANKTDDDILKNKIEAISSLKLLVMVSGFNTPKKN